MNQKRKEQDLAKELDRQYGALAVVILYRATKYGSMFDFEKFT